MVDEAEIHAIEGAAVYDAKGERIGRVSGVHLLEGKLLDYTVELDPEIAGLPGVERDRLRVAPEHLTVTGEESVRLDMTFRDAIMGHATPETYRE